MAYRHTDYRLCCRNPHSKGFAAYDPKQAPHSRDDDPVAQSCTDCRHGSAASPGAAPIGWTCRSRWAYTRIDCGRARFPHRFSHEKPVCHRHRRDPDFGGTPPVFLTKRSAMFGMFFVSLTGTIKNSHIPWNDEEYGCFYVHLLPFIWETRMCEASGGRFLPFLLPG